MEHWVGSGSTAAVIVRWSELRDGEVPLGVREGTPPMDAFEAAWSIDEWFGASDATAARSLYLELEHRLDYVDHNAIKRRLERALRSGDLIAYRVRSWAGEATEGGRSTFTPVGPKPSAPKPSAPTPVETVTPTHFAVRWVDELGEAIADIEVVFSISGTRHKATTDREGIARYTDPGGSGFAWVEPGDLDALREAVRPRWDTIREGEVLTDSDAHVVMLRAPMEGVSLVAEELETLSIQPYVERVRLLGEHFDLNKAFLVPEGLTGVRAILGNKPRLKTSCLHIVGHTDTSANAAYNDKLSLERAKSLKDYLTQNVDGWLYYYGLSVPKERRWGAKEDLLMIDAMMDHASRSATEPAVRWYQRTRGLTEDNIAGPITRAKLIAEYMALAGKPLPASVTVTTHGCGESFSRSETGDGVANDDNRRVEAYFFASELGAQPPAPGATSKPASPEYPEWVRRSRRTEDHGANAARRSLSLRLHDAERRPMSHARATMVMNHETVHMEADDEGFVHVLLPPSCSSMVKVQWGPQDPLRSFGYFLDVILACDAGGTIEQQRNKLHNLGYGEGITFEVAARLFQLVYTVDLDDDGQPQGLADGLLPAATRERVDQIYNERECDASVP